MTFGYMDLDLKDITLNYPQPRDVYQRHFEQQRQFSDAVQDFAPCYAELVSEMSFDSYTQLLEAFALKRHGKKATIQSPHTTNHRNSRSRIDVRRKDLDRSRIKQFGSIAESGTVRLHFSGSEGRTVTYVVFDGEAGRIVPVSARLYAGSEKFYSWCNEKPVLGEKDVMLAVRYRK